MRRQIMDLVDTYVNSEFQKQHAMEHGGEEEFDRAIKDKQQARAALVAALDAADREVEGLKAESANDADAREVERLNELALTLHIVMAQRDALKAECVVQRNEASKVQHENAALKSGWEQERNVADMLEAENAELRFRVANMEKTILSQQCVIINLRNSIAELEAAIAAAKEKP